MRFLVLLLLALAGPTAWAGPAATPAASEAEALMRAGRLSEALPVAKAEAEAAPADIAAQERYIDLLLTVGLFDTATAIYRERAERTNDADSWYLLGRAVPTAEEATVAYTTALERDPAHARAYMGLGAVYRAQGRYDDAVSAYRTTTSIDPSISEAWAGLGAAYLGLRQFDDALAAARQGMAHVPGDPDAYLAVAVLAPEEAPTVLEKALAVAPDDARVHAALAEVRLDQGEGRAARTLAETAISIDPTRNDARLSLLFADAMIARTLDAQGYHDLVEARGLEEVGSTEALAAYDGLVARYPKCSLTYMGRARVRATAHDRDGALADLAEAVRLDPDNIEAMAVYGLVLLEAGRVSEAKPLLDRASAERPYDASLALASATAYARSGDREGALKGLEAAAEAWPYDARVLLAYAKVLAEAGRAQDAYTVLRGGVDRLPGDDRLVLALAAAAKQVGRTGEAADLIDVLAKRSGSAELAEIARKLRAGEL